MGWTFCPPQPGVQHKKETVCCDFCGRCPRCSPTPMEAVSVRGLADVPFTMLAALTN